MTTETTGFVLTGRKVLAITVSVFGLIIAVNLVMAWFAVRTFPGLEVRNSYIASQGFNERLRTQQALGWQTEAELVAGRLTVRISESNGGAAPVATIHAILGRPTTEREDITPELVFQDGVWVADVIADHGNWNLRLQAEAADGTAYAYRIGLIHR